MSSNQSDLDGVKTQKRNLPLVLTTQDCAGRTYIVTGSNTGLGFEAAKHLAALGSAKVILAVRNLEAGNAAKAKILADTKANSDAVDVWALDLSNYDSVKAFANRATAELDRVDSLICNAAVAEQTTRKVEGHVPCITVNVTSTFLLSMLMMPKLRETAKKYSNAVPHIVIVSSRVGFQAKPAWDKIKENPIAGVDGGQLPAYPLSKLIEMMALRHLAPLIPVSRTGVTINLVCPGLCTTDLDRYAAQEFRDQLAALRAQYGRTAEDGSRTLLHGASAGKASHGLLCHSCEIGEKDVPSWLDEDREVQKRTWELIEQELETIDPGCVKNVFKL